MKRRRALLFTTGSVVALCAACGVWLQTQQRQYACNRALIAALVHSDTKTALILVNEGADPNTRQTPIPPPTFKILISQLLHRSTPPANDSPTAFLIACGTHWKEYSGRSAHWVVCEENLPLLRAMLAQGANVQARAKYTNTTVDNNAALWSAISQERLHTVELLLQHGADINARDKRGFTPLLEAIQNDTPFIARLLLSHGANPNAQTGLGETALYYASDDWPVAKSLIPELLASGADPNLPDNQGVSPLQLAQKNHRPDLVQLLTRGTSKSE